MAETYKRYDTGYTGAEIVDLLGRVPKVEQRVAQLENGGGDKHAEFTFYNTSSCRCRHNFGKKPSVTIVDEGTNMILADVRHEDDNCLVVTFGMNATGCVILN